MPELEQLFRNNREWSRRMLEQDPGFFDRLSALQSPKYLWIGCSDSRVPANEIMGLRPGEVFVHRNVANLVLHNDINCLSVIQFAVEVLKVEHIIVCGHYGCGGVRAACEPAQLGLIDNWIHGIRHVRARHLAELDAIADPAARADRLCELNVISQVQSVCQTTIVQNARARGQALEIHGFIYSLKDGLLRDLGVCTELDGIYRMNPPA